MQRPRAKIHYGQDIPGTRKASNLKSSSLVEGRVRPRPDSMAGLARSGVISSALLVSGMMSVRRPVSVSALPSGWDPRRVPIDCAKCNG